MNEFNKLLKNAGLNESIGYGFNQKLAELVQEERAKQQVRRASLATIRDMSPWELVKIATDIESAQIPLSASGLDADVPFAESIMVKFLDMDFNADGSIALTFMISDPDENPTPLGEYEGEYQAWIIVTGNDIQIDEKPPASIRGW